ncbi:hypothetical protein OF117_11505 [Geodermatophilus sp. YIM 151500]|uniref:hypothetical protein n=1 Tax=Geodermatophilus sp. YIM 151500 TaxID=2984531 RepID=UPI0021E45E7C|nr:hypothetical protein [Geodermatophilus sp. YIM 151500]MCV2489986.1 hypothetical protein [Geodermatophilus sp. YIM 151500]
MRKSESSRRFWYGASASSVSALCVAAGVETATASAPAWERRERVSGPWKCRPPKL